MTALLSSFWLGLGGGILTVMWHVLPLHISWFWLPTSRLPFLEYSIFHFSDVRGSRSVATWCSDLTWNRASTLPVSCSFNCEITGPSPAFARRCFFSWTFYTSWHSGARHSRGNTAYNGTTVDPLPLPRYYRILATVPAVLPWNCTQYRGNYRGYRGITAFPITVLFSTT